MATMIFDSVVLGGLPVEVEAYVSPAEPDVGIMSAYATIEDIRWPGRRRKNDRRYIRGKSLPQKVYDRITQHELDALAEEALGDW